MNEKSIQLDHLLTEQRNPRSLHIDQLSTPEILDLINQEDMLVPQAIAQQLKPISLLVEAVVDVLGNGGRLIYAGAGTSGRLGVLDASECPPTFGTDPAQVVGLIAGGDRALRDSIEDAEDDPDLARADLQALNLSKQDIVIGIAASGRTPYTVSAVAYANEIGARSGCISNTPRSPLAQTATLPVTIPVGPEIITGSTRLKSGTAQKLLLNMITTTAMIRLGKVYGNLMVDVQPDNEKLVQRATNIIAQITGASEPEASAALRQYGSVKAAVVGVATGLKKEEVEKRLKANDGRLRDALAQTKE